MKRLLLFLILALGLSVPAQAQTATLSIADATTLEGNSRTREVLFPVTLSRPLSIDVSASFVTKPITASANSDYQPQSAGQIVIRAGQTRTNIIVRVVCDTVEEKDESFLVQLGAPKRVAISDSDGIGYVKDDDYNGVISVSDAAVTEGNSGRQIANARVSLSRAPLHDISIAFETKDDSAKASLSDYIPVQGTLLFKPGRLVLSVLVPVVGDTNIESDERLFVRIGAPGYAIAKSLGAITIRNDDVPSALGVSINDVSVAETDSGQPETQLLVTLDQPAARDTPIRFSTLDGTATAPNDYISNSGVVTVKAGENFASITLPIVGDTGEERDESFTVELSADPLATPGGLSGDTSGTVTIRDNDYDGQISIGDAAQAEGNSGAQRVSLPITLSQPCLHPIRITYSTQDGSARSASDYLSTSGTLLLGPGSTGFMATFSILGDTEIESDEDLHVNINADGLVLLKSSGIFTLINDDIPQPASSGQIAYQAGGDIWIMNGDGSNQSRLTTDPAHDFCPGFSADGKKIAFTSGRGGSFALWVMNSDGSGQRKLFQQNTSWHGFPRFSPDGSKIAFVLGSDNATNFVGSLILINSDGTNPVMLSPNAYTDTSIGFAPSGTKIVFTALRQGLINPAIATINIDGTGEILLTTGANFDASPNFSPDEKRIAFTSYRAGKPQIYTMNADGSGEVLLAPNGFSNLYEPCYSPDGDKITFSVFMGSNYQIAVMNADGSGQKFLTSNDGYGSVWSVGSVPAKPLAAPQNSAATSAATF